MHWHLSKRLKNNCKPNSIYLSSQQPSHTAASPFRPYNLSLSVTLKAIFRNTKGSLSFSCWYLFISRPSPSSLPLNLYWWTFAASECSTLSFEYKSQLISPYSATVQPAALNASAAPIACSGTQHDLIQSRLMASTAGHSLVWSYK